MLEDEQNRTMQSLCPCTDEQKLSYAKKRNADPSEIEPTEKKLKNDIEFHNHFTIKTQSTGDIYTKLQDFLCELYITQHKDFPEFVELQLSRVRHGENKKIIYKLPNDTKIKLVYKKSEIECFVKSISGDHGTFSSVQYLYELSVTAPDKTIIDELVFDACEEKEQQVIYHYDPVDKIWKLYGNVQKRDSSTLIINQKEALLNDLDEFLASEEDYVSKGMPYKRNYLFYGKPGTGKSTLANVMANRTKRNINIVSFDAELGDSGLYNAVNTIDGNKSILLLEDIDCIFQDRSTNANNSKVSFSALLNVLDGVCRTRGLITIITTNYVKQLDKALLRPGRIDMMIKFTEISKEQILGLLELYKISLTSKIIDELMKLTRSHDLTPAVMSAFMFRNRKNKLDDSNYLHLFKKYLEEINSSLPNKDYESLYS